MLRTNNCGELRKAHLGQEVIICGWVQRIRDKGVGPGLTLEIGTE